jgi:hypothetical protein
MSPPGRLLMQCDCCGLVSVDPEQIGECVTNRFGRILDGCFERGLFGVDGCLSRGYF